MKPAFWWLSIGCALFLAWYAVACNNEAYQRAHPGVRLSPEKPMHWAGPGALCPRCFQVLEVSPYSYTSCYFPDGRGCLNIFRGLVYDQTYICRHCSLMWPIAETFHEEVWPPAESNYRHRPNVGIVAGAAAAAR